MKKLLITGASGFIGSHSLPLLIERGYEIHAVSHLQQQPLSQVFWYRADLLDSRHILELVELIRPTHLLHFAWYVAPGDCWQSQENVRWTQASFDLLQSFIKNGGKRVVMAGTCAEYDWNYGYCSEQVTPLAPSTFYGTCKHALQSILAAYAGLNQLSWAWGRVFFLYGPNEHPKRLVPHVIRSLLANKQAMCSEGTQLRDYLYVKDVADAFAMLMDCDIQGPVNIASGCPVSVKEIVQAIASRLNGEELVQFGTLPASAEEPPLVVGDATRLSQELNWWPGYTLDRGLDETIAWWKHRLGCS